MTAKKIGKVKKGMEFQFKCLRSEKKRQRAYPGNQGNERCNTVLTGVQRKGEPSLLPFSLERIRDP